MWVAVVHRQGWVDDAATDVSVQSINQSINPSNEQALGAAQGSVPAMAALLRRLGQKEQQQQQQQPSSSSSASSSAASSSLRWVKEAQQAFLAHPNAFK